MPQLEDLREMLSGGSAFLQRGFRGVAAFFHIRVEPLTFFDELHKHGVVAADCEPEAIFIFLDDHASLDQTCEQRRDETKERKRETQQKSSKGAETRWNNISFQKVITTHQRGELRNSREAGPALANGCSGERERTSGIFSEGTHNLEFCFCSRFIRVRKWLLARTFGSWKGILNAWWDFNLITSMERKKRGLFCSQDDGNNYIIKELCGAINLKSCV